MSAKKGQKRKAEPAPNERVTKEPRKWSERMFKASPQIDRGVKVAFEDEEEMMSPSLGEPAKESKAPKHPRAPIKQPGSQPVQQKPPGGAPFLNAKKRLDFDDDDALTHKDTQVMPSAAPNECKQCGLKDSQLFDAHDVYRISVFSAAQINHWEKCEGRDLCPGAQPEPLPSFSPVPSPPATTEQKQDLKERVKSGVEKMLEEPWLCYWCQEQFRKTPYTSPVKSKSKSPQKGWDFMLHQVRGCKNKEQFKADMTKLFGRDMWCEHCNHLSAELWYTSCPENLRAPLPAGFEPLFGLCSDSKDCPNTNIDYLGLEPAKAAPFYCFKCKIVSNTVWMLQRFEKRLAWTCDWGDIVSRCEAECPNHQQFVVKEAAIKREFKQFLCPVHDRFDRFFWHNEDLGVMPHWVESSRCGCPQDLAMCWCSKCGAFAKQRWEALYEPAPIDKRAWEFMRECPHS